MEQSDEGSLVEVKPARAKGRRFKKYFVFWEPNKRPCIAEQVMIKRGTPEEKKVMYRTNIVVAMSVYRRMREDAAFESEVMDFATDIGFEIVKTVRADLSIPPNTQGPAGVVAEFSYKLNGRRQFELIEGERIPSEVIELIRNDPEYKKHKTYLDWYWREATRIRFQVVSAMIKEKYGADE